MATRNEFIPSSVFKFDNLERPVQLHLKNVYACLGVGMLSAAAGGYMHLFTNIIQAGFLTSIAALGLMIWLATTRHSKENLNKRLAIFTGFTFCSGVSLGPLLDLAIAIEPSIIPTALLGTAVIFISFSVAALYNNNRTFLYMGGFLMSALSWLLILSLANLFLGSSMLFDLNLYLGLFIFCAFVLYDTQLIVEKRRMGDDDYIWHSVDLFLDFINIFRKLMIILSKRKVIRRGRTEQSSRSNEHLCFYDLLNSPLDTWFGFIQKLSNNSLHIFWSYFLIRIFKFFSQQFLDFCFLSFF